MSGVVDPTAFSQSSDIILIYSIVGWLSELDPICLISDYSEGQGTVKNLWIVFCYELLLYKRGFVFDSIIVVNLRVELLRIYNDGQTSDSYLFLQLF